ncbi:MAG: InlB B-repeat-containing protein, partial [Clostridiales bacterium]|nr:InlB B-repeat-containing protein [Clostridiales bacterium]
MRNSSFTVKGVSLLILVLVLLIAIPGYFAAAVGSDGIPDHQQKDYFGEVNEKGSFKAMEDNRGFEKDEPQNLPIENFAHDTQTAKKAAPDTAHNMRTAGREVWEAPSKASSAIIQNIRGGNPLPNSVEKAAELSAFAEFAAPAIMDYTTITVPSVHLLTFDGSEELSGRGCYGKGFKFWGVAGQAVQIQMDSYDIDSYLLLYDSNLNLIAYDDDSGGNYNALIIYNLPSDGYYYIEATMYDNRTGVATLSVGYVDHITYDTNGSRDGLWGDTFVSSQSFQLTPAIPWAPGGNYVFCGWTLERINVAEGANYSGKIYQPEETVILAGPTTLYALWAYCGNPNTLPFNTEASLADSSIWSPFTWAKSYCYSFSLSLGQVLVADMNSLAIDSMLVLYNEAGNFVAFDDDSGGGFDAFLVYQAQTAGTYYLYATTWYNAPLDGSFSLSVRAAEDFVTLTYAANGGYNAPPDNTFLPGMTVQLSREIPTRAGYCFLGWSTSPSATTASYAPGAPLVLGSSDVTLYAIWRPYTPITAPYTASQSLSSSDGYSVFGTYIKGYSIYLTAGQKLSVSMLTDDFWAYLIIRDANWDNVDYRLFLNGDNARAEYDVTSTGTYYIDATIEDDGYRYSGAYTISVETQVQKTCLLTYDA